LLRHVLFYQTLSEVLSTLFVAVDSRSHERKLLAATPRTAPSLGGVVYMQLQQATHTCSTHLLHYEVKLVMLDLTHRKGPAVSVVQDQDIYIEDDTVTDLTITIIGAIETDGVRYFTYIHVSNKVCRTSRWL
jgi:hypothetical protein